MIIITTNVVRAQMLTYQIFVKCLVDALILASLMHVSCFLPDNCQTWDIHALPYTYVLVPTLQLLSSPFYKLLIVILM